MTHSPTHHALLALIARHGPLRRGEIDELLRQQPLHYRVPTAACRPAGVTAYLNSLVEGRLVAGHKPLPGRALVYQVTPAGRRALAGGGGAPAAPRQAQDASHYDGAELRPFAGRPGAMRAFELPSLIDGRRVPRARPVLIGAAGEGRA